MISQPNASNRTYDGRSLGGIGAVFQFPWEKQFNGKDQQEADARGCAYFNNKVQESTEIKPFQQHQVSMV